jgi:diguanylate cyclase (GGDEF)-like protein
VRRAGAWLGPALCVLGCSAVAFAVWRGTDGALVAAAGGCAATAGFTLFFLSRWQGAHPALARPLDFADALDLVRRAHGARIAWSVGLRNGSLEATPSQDGGALPEALRRRGASIVELASVDGREHIVRDGEGVYAAIGDFPYGAGLLLPPDDAEERLVGVVEDLRRLIAGMRAAESRTPEGQGQIVAQQLALGAAGAQTLEGIARAGAELAQQSAQRAAESRTPEGQGQIVAQQLALGAAGAQTLEGIARAGAELAQQSAQRAAVIVVREDDAGVVIAVSSTADKRLAGLRLQPEAPVARAMQTGVPLVTHEGDDVLGPLPGVPDRRRRDRTGIAYPLVDGRLVVGALVLTGPAVEPDGPAAERVRRLVAELGPRLAAAKAVHDAKRRAVLDPLTGLANRGEFERVLTAYARDAATQTPPPASLVYVDLDWFKRLNDTLGHAAGDAALRHVARVLEAAVRDGDLVARIGGEEFAVWLPGASLAQGLEVAERVRDSVHRTAWRWDGSAHPLTTSCGVASYPAPIRDLLNLRAAADAALYRAKQGGRNRVEKAVVTR